MKNKETTYKKILVTHDGSRLASSAMPHAIALAKAFDSDIYLLTVIDTIVSNIPTIPPPEGSVSVNTVMLEDIARKERIAAKSRVTRFKKQLLNNGIANVRTEVVDGYASQTILAYSKKHAIDVIVMATHGRSGFKRAILGSVADEVVRKAGIPVFLIHPLSK